MRGTWAARGLSAQLYMARMRANAKFTPTRLSIDSSKKTFELQIWNNSTSSFQPEGGKQSLGSNVIYGYGSIATPAGAQTPIAQSTSVIFNSRGLPVTDTGAPNGNYAIYLNNSGRFYAVSVSIVGQVETWTWSGSAWKPL